jgi:hypothetical protein
MPLVSAMSGDRSLARLVNTMWLPSGLKRPAQLAPVEIPPSAFLDTSVVVWVTMSRIYRSSTPFVSSPTRAALEENRT